MRKNKSNLNAVNVQLLLRPDQMTVVTRAAELCRRSLSDFILEHAYEAAQQVLAEQGNIVMPPADWAAFCKALDAPPQSIPALKKLFARSGAFDGNGDASTDQP